MFFQQLMGRTVWSDLKGQQGQYQPPIPFLEYITCTDFIRIGIKYETGSKELSANWDIPPSAWDL